MENVSLEHPEGKFTFSAENVFGNFYKVMVKRHDKNWWDFQPTLYIHDFPLIIPTSSTGLYEAEVVIEIEHVDRESKKRKI